MIPNTMVICSECINDGFTAVKNGTATPIGGVMISVATSSAVDRGFDPRSGKTKDYKIGICCYSTKYTALREKRKKWLARNQDNVSEWSEMSTRGLLFQ